MKKIIVASFGLFLSVLMFGQDNLKSEGLNQITNEVIKAQTGFLASDWMEGRETGKKGAFMASDYIASMLTLYGIEPAGDIVSRYDRETRSYSQETTWFQDFTLMASSTGTKQELSLASTTGIGMVTRDFTYQTDFIVTPTEPGGTVVAPVVFVGNGYKNDETGYNDFKSIDVKGKFILRINGTPAGQEPLTAITRRGVNPLNEIAINLGAVGIITFTPGNESGEYWTPEGEFMNMSPAESRSRGRYERFRIPQETIANQIPVVSVTARVANEILDGSGITVADFISGKKHSVSKSQPVKTITLKTEMNTRLVSVRNVIGKIEGKNPDEVIVLGAHFDHLGMRNGFVYNGADDNASGTVAVMSIAKAIASTGVKPEKTIIFALWTGEEKGLLGSRYYAENPTVPLESIKLNFNFDMISRYITDDEPNKANFWYSEDHPEFESITLKNISDYSINLDADCQPVVSIPGGSDHISFTAKGIPVMRFKPGHREEYHTPQDEFRTIDWDIMLKIIKVSYLNTWDLANTNW